MQLTKRDVPSLPFPQGTNLLQMLWYPCEVHKDEEWPLSQFFWRAVRKNEQLLPKTEVPATDEGLLQKDMYVPRELGVFPEYIIEYPGTW